MTFRVELIDMNGVRQVSLSGRLDSATSGDFETHLQTLFESSGIRALMDFSSLDYISSAGLRVVLMAAKRAKQTQGRLVLCSLQPHVKEVFEISGFLKILAVADDHMAALSQLNA